MEFKNLYQIREQIQAETGCSYSEANRAFQLLIEHGEIHGYNGVFTVSDGGTFADLIAIVRKDEQDAQQIKDGRHMLASVADALANGLALYDGIPDHAIYHALIELERAVTAFAAVDPGFLADLAKEQNAARLRHIERHQEPRQDGLRDVAPNVRYRITIKPFEAPVTPPKTVHDVFGWTPNDDQQ